LSEVKGQTPFYIFDTGRSCGFTSSVC